MRSQETIHDEQTTMGAQVNMAVNLLNNFIREIDDNDLFIKVAQLKTLAERGVITYIAKRLQANSKRFTTCGWKSTYDS